MAFSLKPRWRFIYKAAREEFKRSRWYKVVSAATVAFAILNFLGLFGLKIPVPTPSWKLATFFLISIVAALLLVIEAIYRFHRRAISDLYIKSEKAVQIVTRLTDFVGQASLLDSMYHEREDEIPHHLLDNWLTGLRGALQDCFGAPWDTKALEAVPPKYRHSWFLGLRQRLSEEIGYQSTLIKKAQSDHQRLGE